MILYHVAQRPRTLVVARTIFNAELFARGNLDVVNVTLIPEMLEERICEAQDHDILSRFFAQKMIDPERARLVETFVHRTIEVPGSR